MQFQMLMGLKCGARSNISLREQVNLPTTLLAVAHLRCKSAELRICFSFLSLPLGEDAFFDENLQMSHCLMLSAVFFCYKHCYNVYCPVGRYIYMAMNNVR